MTAVPLPTSLSMRMVPKLARMMRWQSDSPSPTPAPAGLVVKNGSKTRLRCSGGIPIAVIDHAHQDLLHVAGAVAAGLVLGHDPDGAAAMLARVGGVEDQIDQHLLNLIVVGERELQVGGQLRIEGDALEAAVVGHQAQRLAHLVVEIETAALGRPRAGRS